MNTQAIPRFQRVAHRGGAALAPENTLAAFHQALTFPIDAVELDVQMSRDGHAVVFHDTTVDRLTDGRGNFLDLDLAYLRTLNAAAHFPGTWPQPERIPMLREVLELAHAGHVQVLIEIKSSMRNGTYGRYLHIVEAVAHEVLATHMEARVLVMSFDWTLLPEIKALLPGTQTGMLVSKDVWDPDIVDALPHLACQAHERQCTWINLDYKLFTPAISTFVHAQGLNLGIWTVNDATGCLRLLEAGVDSITTDHPDLFRLFPE